ncbi:dihydrofolate reductase family protein, partial [Rhizobium sp. Pop5]|uniref:RibD family protein n=1 Tax=Rhizobium sp. Pop5 TaxID=1223565 RepID=UPI0005684EBC
TPIVRVSGRGISMLRNAGIEVTTGVLEEEGRRSLAGYLTRQTKNRPYVTLKLAVSADGMIGREGAGQVAITGPQARAQVQALRAETDAILVGIGTAISDDPLLTVRTPGLEAQSPVRIVLDPLLALPLTSKLVQTAREVPVIVVASEEVSLLRADAEGLPPSALPGISPTSGRAEEGVPPTDVGIQTRGTALEAAGVEIVYCSPYHPDVLLPALATRGISSLLIEGGAKTAKLFLEADLVDRIQLYQSPIVIGDGGIESPLQATDIPSGFAHRGTYMFGADRLDEYEREN